MSRCSGNVTQATAIEQRRNDLELARRCRQGDTRAQQEFVTRYTSLVYSVSRRAGTTRAEAEDVTQDTFLEAFRSLGSFRGEARLSSWLYVLALRQAASHARSRQRQPLACGQPGDPTFPNSRLEAAARDEREPEDRAIRNDRAARVRQAIACLPEVQRSVVIAHYLGELRVQTIAEELDLPEGTVKTHPHRARQALRRALEEE